MSVVADRWWDASGGPLAPDEVEFALLSDDAPAGSRHIALHRLTSRVLRAAAEKPLLSAKDVSDAVVVAEASVGVSKRDVAGDTFWADAREGVELVVSRAVRAGVDTGTATRRAALVAGVPARRLSQFAIEAAKLAQPPGRLESMADKLLFSAAVTAGPSDDAEELGKALATLERPALAGAELLDFNREHPRGPDGKFATKVKSKLSASEIEQIRASHQQEQLQLKREKATQRKLKMQRLGLQRSRRKTRAQAAARTAAATATTTSTATPTASAVTTAARVTPAKQKQATRARAKLSSGKLAAGTAVVVVPADTETSEETDTSQLWMEGAIVPNDLDHLVEVYRHDPGMLPFWQQLNQAEATEQDRQRAQGRVTRNPNVHYYFTLDLDTAAHVLAESGGRVTLGQITEGEVNLFEGFENDLEYEDHDEIVGLSQEAADVVRSRLRQGQRFAEPDRVSDYSAYELWTEFLITEKADWLAKEHWDGNAGSLGELVEIYQNEHGLDDLLENTVEGQKFLTKVRDSEARALKRNPYEFLLQRVVDAAGDDVYQIIDTQGDPFPTVAVVQVHSPLGDERNQGLKESAQFKVLNKDDPAEIEIGLASNVSYEVEEGYGVLMKFPVRTNQGTRDYGVWVVPITLTDPQNLYTHAKGEHPEELGKALATLERPALATMDRIDFERKHPRDPKGQFRTKGMVGESATVAVPTEQRAKALADRRMKLQRLQRLRQSRATRTRHRASVQAASSVQTASGTQTRPAAPAQVKQARTAQAQRAQARMKPADLVAAGIADGREKAKLLTGGDSGMSPEQVAHEMYRKLELRGIAEKIADFAEMAHWRKSPKDEPAEQAWASVASSAYKADIAVVTSDGRVLDREVALMPDRAHESGTPTQDYEYAAAFLERMINDPRMMSMIQSDALDASRKSPGDRKKATSEDKRASLKIDEAIEALQEFLDTADFYGDMDLTEDEIEYVTSAVYEMTNRLGTVASDRGEVGVMIDVPEVQIEPTNAVVTYQEYKVGYSRIPHLEVTLHYRGGKKPPVLPTDLTTYDLTDEGAYSKMNLPVRFIVKED